jgi:TPR repeat protein
MFRLARIYHLGKAVHRDYQKAYELYTKAAELGHSESSRTLDIVNYSVGHSYTEDGEATAIKYSEDLKNSLLMVKFVAQNGAVNLQYKPGLFYMSNTGRLNYNEAFKWYQIAASKENTDAIY